MSTIDPLIAAAAAARERAFAPFSHFLVGAALETEDGTIVTGCNVESASYGLTTCAERVAVFKGVSEGLRCFKRVAVVTDTDTPTPPCGACRQVLWEFAPDAEVILANLTGTVRKFTMRELLPEAFDARQLGG
ncbi:MAG TPA: cytidine deaminase [Gemmataceae bacterium]|nr:cytidine deaminase [Gemmataceae bacterium]